jgi:hypothetical protein
MSDQSAEKENGSQPKEADVMGLRSARLAVFVEFVRKNPHIPSTDSVLVGCFDTCMMLGTTFLTTNGWATSCAHGPDEHGEVGGEIWCAECDRPCGCPPESLGPTPIGREQER